MSELDEIGVRCGTDKSSLDHSYTLLYEQYFESLRKLPVCLVELGVYRGHSLQMWSQYFTHPLTNIVGIDNNLSRYGSISDRRVRTFTGDQAEIPTNLADRFVDIVIDDASHISSKTIQSFGTWWEHLRRGGLYVVEDLVTSYDPVHFSHMEASSNPNQSPMLGGQTAVQFFRSRVDDVVGCPAQHRIFEDIEWLHFHPNLVILKKKP